MAPSSKGARLLFVPRLHAEETIYGYVAAIHRVNGVRRAEDTSHALFGTGQAMRRHDLPVQFLRFAQNMKRPDGDPGALLRKHTIAAYYWPFIEGGRAEALLQNVLPGKSEGTYRGLSVGSRTIALSHPLKWCEDCSKADEVDLGRPIWRVEHQFPTTWLCLRHGRLLCAIPGRHRVWLVPGDRQGKAAHEARVLDEGAAHALAEIGSQLLAAGRIDMETLRAEAVQHLRDIGVFHDAKRAWHTRMVKWFSATSLSRAIGKTASPLSKLALGDWIATLLFRRKSNHPVRWVLLCKRLAAAS